MNGRPSDKLAIAVAQLNSTVGDIAGNAEKVRRARMTAAAQGADLVVFPELFIAGYPPEDLVLKPAFQAACRAAIEALARETVSGGPALLVGTPWLDGGKLYNAVALLDGGNIAALRFKVDLPNYGVFDEKRVFAPGPMPGPVNFRGVRLGLPICEDIWGEEIVECLAETGAELLVVPNGSPYWRQKGDVRLNIAVARVTEQGLPTVYVNQVGAQDELVFDGVSFGLHADCSPAFQLAAFQEVVVTTHWQRRGTTWRCEDGPKVAAVEAERADYAACVSGLRDYVNKNGFPGVVLGLSGGIDSALCAAMAVDALGSERVDRHRRAQRRIDPARQAEHNSGKAVLIDVVAQARHACRIVGAFGFDGRNLRPILTAPGRAATLPMRRDDDFLKGRELERRRAIGVQAERHAVEHQFVLSADLVDVDGRQTLLGHARHRDVEAHVAFLPPIRRAVRHHQQFSAGFGQTLDDFLTPDVFADRQPQPHAAEIHRPRHRSRREHPLFVEHTVIRQIDLETQRRDVAAVEECHRVVELAAVEPGRADQQRRAAGHGFPGQGLDRRAAGGLECRLEHQVLGRIAGNEQLGENDQIGALGRGGHASPAHFLGIAGDIADSRI